MVAQTVKDRILEYLLSNPVTDADSSKKLRAQFYELTEDMIDSVLVDLQEEELVHLTMGGGDFIYADAAPKAHSYIQSKKEAETAAKAGRRRDFVEKVCLGAVGAAITLLLAELLRWLKTAF